MDSADVHVTVMQGNKRDSGASLPPTSGTHLRCLSKEARSPAGSRAGNSLDRRGSYFGDGISAANCECRVDGQFDGAGNTLFGGVALVDSHLSGTLRFEFFPIGPDKAEFKLRFEPLTGEDSILSAPVLFRMPFEQTSRVGLSRTVRRLFGRDRSRHRGYASRLRVFAKVDAIALRVLVGANPSFPTSPLGFISYDATISPLEYGSAWARFEQRPDGKLDFTFYAFKIRSPWPRRTLASELPPALDGRHATIPASGTAMHPHLRLTTKPYARQAGGKTSRSSLQHAEGAHVSYAQHRVRRWFRFARTGTRRAVDRAISHILGRTVVQFRHSFRRDGTNLDP